MDEYVKRAMDLGFSRAVFLSGISIECKPVLRAYCNPEQCTEHGKSWVCPPGCGTLEECAERVNGFREGILLQSITRLNPPTELAEYKRLNREHNIRFRDFIEIVKRDFPDILPLATGGCVFCKDCCYPEPCIRPDVKMESLSAFGIDVGNLCESAGLPFSFRDDMVYYTALLLIKPV